MAVPISRGADRRVGYTARRCSTGSDGLQGDGQGQPHFHIPRVVLLVQAGTEIPSRAAVQPCWLPG